MKILSTVKLHSFTSLGDVTIDQGWPVVATWVSTSVIRGYTFGLFPFCSFLVVFAHLFQAMEHSGMRAGFMHGLNPTKFAPQSQEDAGLDWRSCSWFFGMHRGLFCEFVPNGQGVNAVWYPGFLHQLCEAICCVVISQTHWLVSRERLSSTAGTTLFILYTVVPSVQWWF